MYIYAPPLAHRLGLFAIKTELEELSFKWENQEVYKEIEYKLQATHKLRTNVYEHFAGPVIEKLNELGFKYEIRAREKSIYSIWNKMQAKGVPFEEIYDIFAVRIIFENEPGIDEKKRCWDIYSVITDIYKLRPPDRIRDWVSRPKSNGYQALHLTVMGPDGQWIEIQIRSRRMDDIAEKGFAAHWKYKEGKIEEDTELDKWLKTIKEILESPSPNAMDFLDTIKLNLFSQEIFVFTPPKGGEIRTLAQGATALDFAYDLHSDIGDHCIGAKVNHKLVPFSEKLNSGDQVEILTSKTQQPKAEWLGLVTTAKARTKIEYALRRIRRDVAKKGEEILNKGFKEAEMELTPAILDRMMDYYQKVNKEELFYAIGNNDIALPQRIDKILSLKKQNPDNLLLKYMKQAFHVVKKGGDKEKGEKPVEYEHIDPKKTYILEEDSFNKNFKIPTCCNPIPGDKVFGYLTDDNEVEVHSIHCPVGGLKLKASQGDRIINLEWGGSYTQFPFHTTITVSGIDRMGILNEITKVITAGSLNIKGLNVETNDGVFEGKINIYVHDVNDLQALCSRIAKIKGVKAVNRK